MAIQLLIKTFGKRVLQCQFLNWRNRKIQVRIEKGFIYRVIAISSAVVIASGAVASADPSYYPTGPQINVAVSTVSSGGWTRCYSDFYSSNLPSLETFREQCQGDYVLYAAGSVADTSNFLLLAAGEAGVVFAGTNFLPHTVVEMGAEQLSNGTYFYAQDTESFGFSENSIIQLWTADICVSYLDNLQGDDGNGGVIQVNPDCDSGDDGSKRLSWHGNLNGGGGWRIGTTTDLNGSNAFLREVWVSNSSSRAVMPLTQTTPVSATVANDVMTCSAGSYKVGMSEVEVSSVMYHLYVNNERISTVIYDKGSNIPAHLKVDLPNKVTALVSAKDALFDLSGMSSYSAHCVVEAFGYSSSSSSFSNTYQDAAFIAAANATAQAWEDQRSSATAANFTKEARELRKRIAARSKP